MNVKIGFQILALSIEGRKQGETWFQILAFSIEGRKQGEIFLQVSINGEQKVWYQYLQADLVGFSFLNI